MTKPNDSRDPLDVFEEFRDAVAAAMATVMEPYIPYPDAPFTYDIYEDYRGYPQVRLEVGDLRLIHPDVVEMLRDVTRKFPGWEIVMPVYHPFETKTWPEMGMKIRATGIVDSLLREYFPPEHRHVYRDAKVGTADD